MSNPHAYIHRSHTSGDPHFVQDAYIANESGIVVFTDGKMAKGTKQDIFESALLAKQLDKLEMFAVLDTNDGLLVSQGTPETSYALHKHKHPNGNHAAVLHLPEKNIKYHTVWEESESKLRKHKPKEVIEKLIQKKIKAAKSKSKAKDRS